MTTFTLKYVHAFKDRHGKQRHYFRRAGQKRVTLPGTPGSAEFMRAYEAALASTDAPAREIGSERTRTGTFGALIVEYLSSAEYHRLSHSTQDTRRRSLDRFRAEYGDNPVSRLERKHILRIRDGMVDRPEAANNLVKVLSVLLKFAVDRDYRKDNPASRIARLESRNPDGFHTWTEVEIATFRARWRLGTKQRLAFELLLCTAQRSSDVRLMGPQMISSDRITIRQQKTNERLSIPIHQQLKAAIRAFPPAGMLFLPTALGKPFTAKGFQNWFVDAVHTAGLGSGISAHGLRKAAARRLAEAGCSPHEIQSITGHRTLKEVERYTRMADQLKLAHEAIRKLESLQPPAEDQGEEGSADEQNS